MSTDTLELASSSGPKQKILYFVTEDWYFVSHRIDLAIAAKNAGYDVSVVTQVNEQGQKIKDAGLNLIPLRVSRGGTNPFKDALLLFRLIGLYRKLRPSIVHQIAMKPVVYGSIAAWLARVPRVINAMAGLGIVFTSERFRVRLLRPVVKMVLSSILDNDRTTLILQNPDNVSEFVDNGLIDRSRVALIYGSGVDPNAYPYVAEIDETPIVIIPTRMIWDKGVGEFVRAAELLRQEGRSARFVLIGDTDPQNPAGISREQLQAWNDSGVVEWWGYRSNMAEIFAGAHIVCLPTSYGEGVPKVLIEAASCGRPIVTTDSPGCREIVLDGENGFLVPAKDAAALANAIGKLLNSAQLRVRFGLSGRELVKHRFSLDRVIRETLSLYGKPRHG